jgi:hypothetical protein
MGSSISSVFGAKKTEQPETPIVPTETQPDGQPSQPSSIGGGGRKSKRKTPKHRKNKRKSAKKH